MLTHKQTQFNHSITGVIPRRTHGFGLWGGERKVVCIRIDETLYKAVKPVLKQYFGSVCAAIEPYLATLYSVATTQNLGEKNGVIPSITVDIGNMNIRRALKVRRKMVIEEEVTEMMSVEASRFLECPDRAFYQRKPYCSRVKKSNPDYVLCGACGVAKQ